MANSFLKFIKLLDPKNYKHSEPLAKYSPIKIGGPADIYYEAETMEDFINTIKKAHDLNVPITPLGGMTNVLISDKGIRGLVIRNKAHAITISGELQNNFTDYLKQPESRWESDSKTGTFKYEFKDLDYDESDKPRIEVTMDSGVSLPYALQYLLDQGITGLQWYSGIPGTMGGAVFNNIHGGTHFISEVLYSVKILNKQNNIVDLSISELGIDYDKSRFHSSGETILQATFHFYKGDIEKARFVTREWAERKKIQPRNSPGCAFCNITQEQKEKLGYPTTAIGYIVEKVLNMTGFHIGDAAISPAHHNFIVNNGNATATDYLNVMKEIAKRTKDATGITIVPEIILLGFDDEEIEVFKAKHHEKLRKTRNKDIKTVYRHKHRAFSP